MTPTCDLFVRKLNLELYERVFPPMNSGVSPVRRALLNEIAFGLLRLTVARARARNDNPILQQEVDSVVSQARARVASLEADPTILDTALSTQEKQDYAEQTRRLNRMLVAGADPASILMDPPFPGCGILDNCRGDLVRGQTLFEVKAGDRSFRSVDVRQLITYAALNYQSKAYSIERVGLVNPRLGVRFETELEVLCKEVSGRSAPDLLSDLIYSLSSGDASR